ncbi:MAG: hypothetical protein ACFFAL_09780 [Promethearchaeota archaeon]
MSNVDTAKTLTRVGAILLIISGFIQLGENILLVVLELLSGYLYRGFLVNIGLGIVTIIFGFLILFVFYPMIDTNRTNAGIFIMIFGVIALIGGWWLGWVGSILCLVASILILIEEKSEV